MLVDAPKRPPTSMNVHLKKQRGLRKARYPYWGARLRMATARRRGIKANGRFTRPCSCVRPPVSKQASEGIARGALSLLGEASKRTAASRPGSAFGTFAFKQASEGIALSAWRRIRAIPIGGGFKANGRHAALFLHAATRLEASFGGWPHARTPHFREAFALAERGGFEPPVQFNPYGSLANYWFKPLTHLSNSGGKYSRPIQFCDPGWIRTNDHQLRRQVLYPAELRDRRVQRTAKPVSWISSRAFWRCVLASWAIGVDACKGQQKHSAMVQGHEQERGHLVM